MTIYFQHVGEKGGHRDFPKTIGTRHGGLVHFEFQDLAGFLEHLPDEELQNIEEVTAAHAPEGFQVWGIPSGAKSVLKSLAVGDYLLLLETPGPGGAFWYAGRVIAAPSSECFDLSQHLWGEARFPLIVFMNGGLTSYGWYDFCDRLEYKRNWNPAGNTYRVPSDRIERSVYGDEGTLVRHVVGHDIPLGTEGMATDYNIVDPVEVMYEAEEGRRVLREHLLRERSSALIRRFKESLVDPSCSLCGFNFLAAYGEIGRDFIEAHHLEALSATDEERTTTLADLIPVCSNCHRMLHRRIPMLQPEELREALAQAHIERHAK